MQLPKVPVELDKGWRLCFGCGPDNPIGFHLKFAYDGKITRGEFTPDTMHQGWTNIVHGGVISLLLDEVMGYAVVYENIPSVTAQMNVRFKKPAIVGQTLVMTASVTKKTNHIAETEAKITTKDGTLIAEAKATMFIVANVNLSDVAKQVSAENDAR